MEIPKEIITRVHNERLERDLRSHIKQHGWYNTTKVLRELIAIYVECDSDFTELDNALRKIERNTEDKSDIPDSSLEPPANYFS